MAGRFQKNTRHSLPKLRAQGSGFRGQETVNRSPGSIDKGQQTGFRLPYPEDSDGPETGEQETTYLIETDDGYLTRVPESKLDAWEEAQRERGNEPLNRGEQQLKDAIVRGIYG